MLSVCFLTLLAILGVACQSNTNNSILSQGQSNFSVGPLQFRLSTSNQVLTSLQGLAGSSEAFEFLATPNLIQQSGPGYYHVGDIDLRWRSSTDSSGAWNDCSSAMDRSAVVVQTPVDGTFASADLTKSLAVGAGAQSLPFSVQRTWAPSTDNDSLLVTYNITSLTDDVEFGGVGFAQVYYNDWTNLDSDQTYSSCVIADPAIHSDGGYVQVNRVNGASPSLLVSPLNTATTSAPLTQWRNIKTQNGGEARMYYDSNPQSFTNEGSYNWMVNTGGFTDDDTQAAQTLNIERGEDWVPPTTILVPKGQSRSFTLAFSTADGPRDIQSSLLGKGKPVVTAFPSAVLRQGLTNELIVQYNAPASVQDVYPAEAVTVSDEGKDGNSQSFTVTPSPGVFGRVRLTLKFQDGLTQTIQLYVTKSGFDTMQGYGQVMTGDAYYTRTDDYFGRYGVMSFDHVERAIVLDANCAWIAGQGDEGGSAYMGVFAKQIAYPVQSEIQLLEKFLNTSLYGALQYRDGANASNVRKSLFYYDPTDSEAAPYYSSSVDHAGTWDYAEAHRVDRAYDYPHVTVAWWSMYRVARYHQNATQAPWQYFLSGAYNTVMAMFNQTADWNAAYYTQFGLMEGSVFEALMVDLQREGWQDEYQQFDAKMQAREKVWAAESNPFGSEMAWDSTGQEEVYTWLRHYGDQSKADYTIATITAIQALIAHWSYGGTNRRYWDFQYTAKLARFERMGHHYESGLSAIPLLDAFRRNPTDTFLLQIAYAGLEGALTTVQQSGAPSTAFHQYPDAMNWDAWSGDSALGMFGHLFSTGAYVVQDSTLGGWKGFRADVQVQGTQIRITPSDTIGQRVFIAPLSLYITVDAGQICSVTYDSDNSNSVTVNLCASSDPQTPKAFLRTEYTTGTKQAMSPPVNTPMFLGAIEVVLSSSAETPITLTS